MMADLNCRSKVRGHRERLWILCVQSYLAQAVQEPKGQNPHSVAKDARNGAPQIRAPEQGILDSFV
jgi:hypothetical protein